MHWTVDGKKTILVKNVTTDSASFVGVQMAMKEFMKDSWTVRRLAVPIHRGQSPFKQGMKAKFSIDMFSGSTAAEKKEIQKALMIDVKERAHGVFKTLMEWYNGNLDQIYSRLDHVVDCYSGICGETCRWSVTLCSGGKFTSWWAKSAMFSSYNLQKSPFQMTEMDRILLTKTVSCCSKRNAL